MVSSYHHIATQESCARLRLKSDVPRHRPSAASSTYTCPRAVSKHSHCDKQGLLNPKPTTRSAPIEQTRPPLTMCVQEILIYNCGHRVKGTLDSGQCNSPANQGCASTTEDVKFRSGGKGERICCPACTAECIAAIENEGVVKERAGRLHWGLTDIGRYEGER